MLIIEVGPGGLERALKVLKRRFSQAGTVQELRERTEYRRPGERRRDVLKQARYSARYRRLYGSE